MKYLLWLLVLIAFPCRAQVLCENGYAGEYPCDNVDLLAHVPPSAMGGGTTNEVWGWTDPLDSTEYVILGKSDGVAFFDITDPIQPQYLGLLPTYSSSSLWRTFRTMDHYLFVGSEANGHGMQVFDLHHLRDVVNPPLTFAEDAHYSGFSRAHTLCIEESTGYLFACGTNTFLGGLHIVNIQDPLNPVIAGGYDDDGYTHEAQVMIYNGPDADYSGHTIVFCYNGNSPANLTIVDATDPTDAQTVSITAYPVGAYCHQGWLTEDGRYLLMDDELDEYYNYFGQTRTLIWNVEDLDNPQYMGDFLGTTEAIDHNQYIIGNIAFQSNYTAGLRLVDVSEVADTLLKEVGYFDHFPASNDNVFDGEWMNYPYFSSGVIPLTDIDNGLFLVEANFLHLVNPTVEGCTLQDEVTGSFWLGEGFAGPISFEASGLPEGALITFSPALAGSGDTVVYSLQNLINGLGVPSFTITATGAHFSYHRSVALQLSPPDTFFQDADGDGHGSADVDGFILACEQPDGYALSSDDCNDGDPTIFPGAAGTGENVDNDCSGQISGNEVYFCADIDGDLQITVMDLLLFTSDFPCAGSCVADVDGSGSVGVSDLILVLADYGETCE